MLAGELLGLELPQFDKRLLVIAETDGCSVDGLACATGCSVGRRTMRIEDYGKVAAAFIDTERGTAFRLTALPESRQSALAYAPEARSTWEGQLLGYQRIPSESLIKVQSIRLVVPLKQIISRPGARAICADCGEEINNERELVLEGRVLCRACAGYSYYDPCEEYVERFQQIAAC
jgi:formylmethanofuran dehydrogenase subunit E